MQVSFGRFDLDESGRSLRLDGGERPLQPLVFDLLLYLVHHRERVVPKEELLTQLWADATVTDGSLQRAVSLLRGVLREGGMEHAVQTFARRGYRFCESARVVAGSTAVADAELSASRLSRVGQWERALAEFSALPDPAVLCAADWEAWGSAALCAGRPEQATMPLERAVAGFERDGDLESAARCALHLTNVELEGRRVAVAQGWHQRALSYLRGQPECKQHGLGEWLASRLALFGGHLDECQARAAAAMQIAE